MVPWSSQKIYRRARIKFYRALFDYKLWRLEVHFTYHTVNSGSEMVEAKHVSGIEIYWSTFIGKSKERKIFDFLHCPFEPPAKQHRPVCQLGCILWCMLAQPSKGQCRNSKIFPPLLLAVKEDQNIFFPETCFASTISEPEFTVCITWEPFNKSRRKFSVVLTFCRFIGLFTVI